MHKRLRQCCRFVHSDLECGLAALLFVFKIGIEAAKSLKKETGILFTEMLQLEAKKTRSPKLGQKMRIVRIV